MVVLPWTYSASPTLNTMSPGSSSPGVQNPFDSVFGSNSNSRSVLYSNFLRKVFAASPSDVALFVERAPTADVPLPSSDGYHLFLPFFGGADDRLALELAVQLCANPLVCATVVRIAAPDSGMSRPELVHLDTIDQEKMVAQINFAEDTVYAPHSTNAALASDTADGLLWARYAQTPAASLPAHVTAALSRVTFKDAAPSLRSEALSTALGLLPASESVIVIAGRARRIAGSPARKAHAAELQALGVGGDLSRTVGDVGAAFLAVPPGYGRAFASGVLVVQAAQEGGQGV